MDISVVVRTLGRARLAEALDSLDRQTHRRFEAVVVDMSGGTARRAIDSAGGRLPRLQHLDVGGPLDRALALNHAIGRASGQVITILDDDSLYEPAHLESLTVALEATGCDLVYTGVRRETYTPDGRLVHVDYFQQAFDYGRLLIENFIYASSLAFRRTLWRRLGGYDRRFPVYEDWDFLIRAGRVGSIAAVDGFTAVPRSFTGRPGVPEHHREAADCRRCWVGLMWRHRGLRRRALRSRRELLATEGRHLPSRGVRRSDLGALLHWWWRGIRHQAQGVRIG